jgi:hypothetical protein
MENTGFSKYTISFGLALALASVVNALLVVAKEKIPSVMTGLKSMTSHHWISHGVIVVGTFTVSGWILAQANGGRGLTMTVNRLVSLVVSGVVLGGLIIVSFYLIAD